MKIHPFAEIFPMLDKDEFDELVADIKSNGLLHPIVKDREERLIDGRNRLAACKIAGVEPTFRVEEGDPVAYILAANVRRRHLTKGQMAMAVAKAYPDGGKGGRGRGNPEITSGFSDRLLREARFVLRHAPELAEQVMGGASLNEAYERTVEIRRQQEELEQLQRELKLTMEKMSAEKAIEINTNLDTSFGKSDNTLNITTPNLSTLQSQQQILRYLVDTYEELKRRSRLPTLPTAYDQEDFVKAIRSAVLQIIQHAKMFADNYNQTLVQPTIKRVK